MNRKLYQMYKEHSFYNIKTIVGSSYEVRMAQALQYVNELLQA